MSQVGGDRRPRLVSALTTWSARGLLLACAAPLLAQGPSIRPYWQRGPGLLALRQASRDAASDQQALIVASHPDDRYVMSAAYLRLARSWRVAVLLLTRGEGGQNSQGPQLGDELGWLRTMESEAGAAMLDSDLYYLNRQDAGYCRTAQEALELWGEADSVREMARLIRRIRPDVVLTPHHPDESHGHDLALLRLLPQAIQLAADPQAGGVAGAPHAVAKVFRGPSAEELGEVRDALPVEEMDRAHGDTYRRLAYAALRQHQTQEPILPLEQLFEPLVRLLPAGERSALPASAWTLDDGLSSLFTILPASPETLALKNDLDRLAENVGEVELMVASAVGLHGRLQRLRLEPGSEADLRRGRRLEALERVVRLGSGLSVIPEVAPPAVVIAGRPFAFTLRVQNARAAILKNLRIAAPAGDTLELAPAARQRLTDLADPEPFRLAATYTSGAQLADRRRWLRELFRADTFEPAVRLECAVAVVDPTGGTAPFDMPFEIPIPADVRAPVELEIVPRAVLLTRGSSSQTLTVRLTRNTSEPLRDRLELLGPPGFEITPSPVAVDMGPLVRRDYVFNLLVPARLHPGVYNIYVHLGDQRVAVPVHKVDVAVGQDLTVGLIRGADNTAEDVLQGFVGKRLERLRREDLATRPLGDFDTIVVDIRALRGRSDSDEWKFARAAFPRLLDYVKAGGRLVVLYHKGSEFNVAEAGFRGSPYRLHIGVDRVTREDAPVEILRPDHILMQRPNEILPEDWDGWVQERGLYFPDDYADEFEEIVEMSDPGRPRVQAGLLYARYGAGEYVYCALALYRQLNNLHPGACRIFANLVSR